MSRALHKSKSSPELPSSTSQVLASRALQHSQSGKTVDKPGLWSRLKSKLSVSQSREPTSPTKAAGEDQGDFPGTISMEVGIRPSFYWNKAIMSEEERMLAVLSAKSLKSDSQDEACCKTNFGGRRDCVFIGVFDGHGPEGRAAAKFANQHVQRCLAKDRRTFSSDAKKRSAALKAASYSCHKKMADQRQSGFDAYFSGTTAVYGIFQNGRLHIANCGDSRAVLARGDGHGGVMPIALTADAKPEMPQETKRIVKKGGNVLQMSDTSGNRIGPYRVYKRGTEYPGLAMSRSLGDITAHSIGVIAKPERTHYRVLPEDLFVVFASDGIWQVMSNKEVVQFVYMYMNMRDEVHTCADALSLHAQDMWKAKMEEVIVDDIGVAILHFKELPPPKVKRSLPSTNKAAPSNDLANQMYRKWEQSPGLDPGLTACHMHFSHLIGGSTRSQEPRAQRPRRGRRKQPRPVGLYEAISGCQEAGQGTRGRRKVRAGAAAAPSEPEPGLRLAREVCPARGGLGRGADAHLVPGRRGEREPACQQERQRAQVPQPGPGGARAVEQEAGEGRRQERRRLGGQQRDPRGGGPQRGAVELEVGRAAAALLPRRARGQRSPGARAAGEARALLLPAPRRGIVAGLVQGRPLHGPRRGGSRRFRRLGWGGRAECPVSIWSKSRCTVSETSPAPGAARPKADVEPRRPA
uniref:protein-serine/threonine phosphatase n=1 Tax=Tetraselmis sp. GSL018 TaxID=582737 RepID=A0A061RK87_9CHLO